MEKKQNADWTKRQPQRLNVNGQWNDFIKLS